MRSHDAKLVFRTRDHSSAERLSRLSIDVNCSESLARASTYIARSDRATRQFNFGHLTALALVARPSCALRTLLRPKKTFKTSHQSLCRSRRRLDNPYRSRVISHQSSLFKRLAHFLHHLFWCHAGFNGDIVGLFCRRTRLNRHRILLRFFLVAVGLKPLFD
jgi:hypothetical protein